MNQQLLADIYDRYHLVIYRSIYRQVGDVETARDLTADVFHRLLKAVQDGKGPTRDSRAWLYRTAHNIVVDHYRRQSFRDHQPLDWETVDHAQNTAQFAEDRITAVAVRHALAHLTPDQMQVISLKFLDGMSNQETASIMGRSTGAVKALQHRALKALKRKMNRDDSRSTIRFVNSR